MEKKASFKIPTGFKIIKQSEIVDSWEMVKILTSQKRNKYTKAIRNFENFELMEDILVCPFCNTHYVANNSNRMFCRYKDESEMAKSLDNLRKFINHQVSFFDEEIPACLHITPPVKIPSFFICPNCNNKSFCSEKERTVDIENQKNKIILKCEISDISEMFSIKWLPENLNFIDFPLYETVTFNFKKGRVSVMLKTKKEGIVCIRDVTNQPEMLVDSVAGKIISDYKIVNRTLKRFFIHNWGGKLPYEGSSIDVTNFFKMTRFVGYNKDFYDYIPYQSRTYEIDASFKNVAKEMKNAKNIVNIYNSSKLPQVKSIRKICFENPGMLFYLDELETLYEIIEDINVYLRLLNTADIMELLSELHIRPLITEYFIDFIRVKGVISFAREIEKSWYELKYEAINYISANSFVKKKIQQNWSTKKYFEKKRWNDIRHSIPMMQPLSNIKDCTVDGYKFFWLRNSNDYILAGEKLRNCLGSWHPGNSPVMCVKKQENYVASIELSQSGIEQALTFDNNEIENDENLFKAFEKWRTLNNLEFVY